jgi:hypothetical protein
MVLLLAVAVSAGSAGSAMFVDLKVGADVVSRDHHIW